MSLLENPVPNIDLFIKIGCDWSLSFTIKDNNGNLMPLTNYTCACKIRDRVGGNLIATPTCTVTVGTSTVTLSLTNAVTGAINAQFGVYDVILTSGSGSKTAIFQGKVYFDPLVTK